MGRCSERYLATGDKSVTGLGNFSSIGEGEKEPKEKKKLEMNAQWTARGIGKGVGGNLGNHHTQ